MCVCGNYQYRILCKSYKQFNATNLTNNLMLSTALCRSYKLHSVFRLTQSLFIITFQALLMSIKPIIIVKLQIYCY